MNEKKDYDKSLKINKYEAYYNGLNNVIYYVLQFIILLTCGYLFIKGHIVYSVFMMINTYIWRIDEVAETLSSFGVNYNKVKVSLSRIDVNTSWTKPYRIVFSA